MFLGFEECFKGKLKHTFERCKLPVQMSLIAASREHRETIIQGTTQIDSCVENIEELLCKLDGMELDDL